MSKIILVSVDYKHSYKHIDVDSLVYRIVPFGLAYLGSILKKHGYETRIIDLNAFKDPLKKFESVIKEEKPTFVGISCMTPSLNRAIQIADTSKKISKKIKVIIGGYHVTALPFEIIKHKNIDFVIVGEAEKTIVNLVSGTPLKKIKGLVYKKNRKIIKNPEQDIILDLDTLPYPFYPEFYKSKEDIKNFGIPISQGTSGIVESRGCPYNCIFCANKLMNKNKIRMRSPKNVVNEIEMLHQKYEIAHFSFYDAALTLNKERLYKICQEIIRKKLKIRWICSSRVDLVNKETLILMKKAGCTSIYFGIESGDPKILKIIKKEITLEQVEKTIHLTKSIGIICIGLFMIGHPFETKDSIKNTIEFAKKLPLDYAEFNIAIPLPGTELWNMAKNKQGLEILATDWDEYSAYGKPAIKTLKLAMEQLEDYQKVAYKQFYIRPSYLIKRIIFSKNLFQDFKKSIILLRFLMQK